MGLGFAAPAVAVAVKAGGAAARPSGGPSAARCPAFPAKPSAPAPNFWSGTPAAGGSEPVTAAGAASEGRYSEEGGTSATGSEASAAESARSRLGYARPALPLSGGRPPSQGRFGHAGAVCRRTAATALIAEDCPAQAALSPRRAGRSAAQRGAGEAHTPPASLTPTSRPAAEAGRSKRSGQAPARPACTSAGRSGRAAVPSGGRRQAIAPASGSHGLSRLPRPSAPNACTTKRKKRPNIPTFSFLANVPVLPEAG